ncbi:MAG: alkaline phosphatase family protein [Pyrinomonadaceae bacterium]|nr:alkaline phosphatase family protein [Pyrinomonadaceae bacterium]
MELLRSKIVLGCLVLLILVSSAAAQGVKRLVVMKIDGLPGYLVDKYVKEIDPATGKSQLPWIAEAFYKNGTRLDNFYTRGMSLSGPSWSTIDTGQHLHVKGNVEYDRYTLHSYDYLNFVPFFIDYGLKKVADMPALEVLDQLEVPILADIFPYTKRYISAQLYQRGNRWEVIGSGFMHLYPGSPGDMMDEWAMGIHFSSMTMRQNERDIVNRLVNKPEFDYLDYYDVSFDHVAHGNHDPNAQLADIKKLDRTIGRFWTAIGDSSRAGETALVLVSDHGFNSKDKVYSQGYNLVKLLNKRAAGAHHVITKRRLMLDYSVKALYPFTPLIRTPSGESLYLKGQSKDYPTALFDFDGNERASVQLRNSDLNVLHILLQQLQRDSLKPDVRKAAVATFFDLIERHRADWDTTVREMSEELEALHRQIEAQDKVIAEFTAQFDPKIAKPGVEVEGRRIAAQNKLSRREEADYRAYLDNLRNLLSLKKEGFEPKDAKIETLIAPGAMGDHNSIYQLQNYVAGPSQNGLVLDNNGRIDMTVSFQHVNYFELFTAQTVRNNVQPDVSNRPIDFVATTIPRGAFGGALTGDLKCDADPIWLYAGRDRQALLLTRNDGGGSIRYLPIVNLMADTDGSVSFDTSDWAAGLPLKILEDPALNIAEGNKAAWLNRWHTEVDWLRAVHRTMYSNGIIGLIEQLGKHTLFDDAEGLTADHRLIRRFRERQRHLAETDMLIMANNHWNFDVKGFNPGGNHGSFFRVSTNSTFMIAGGETTGIPRGLEVDEPYDNLSVLPTILSLMGRIDENNRPDAALSAMGFRRFPGRVVTEIVGARSSKHSNH